MKDFEIEKDGLSISEISDIYLYDAIIRMMFKLGQNRLDNKSDIHSFESDGMNIYNITFPNGYINCNLSINKTNEDIPIPSMDELIDEMMENLKKYQKNLNQINDFLTLMKKQNKLLSIN